jgi:hypothetical protein
MALLSQEVAFEPGGVGGGVRVRAHARVLTLYVSDDFQLPPDMPS